MNNIFKKILNRLTILSSYNQGDVGNNNQVSREIWLKNKLLKIRKDSIIIDIGAGELKYKKFCNHLKYISQDFAQYDGIGDGLGQHPGKWDQSKIDIVSDITSIPKNDDSCDAVMCIEVLEHVPDPVSALKEMSRLLKPGGHIIVTAPFCSLTHFSPYYYQNGFSKYFYEYWYDKFGLKIIEMEFNGNFFEWMAQELKRINFMAGKHSNDQLNPIELSALNILLGGLNRFSKNNNNSESSLCFGIHVFAVKEKGMN